jgi:Arginine-tRNA-protein transferase, C terminus
MPSVCIEPPPARPPEFLSERRHSGKSVLVPDASRRSLGSFVILDHIEKARRLGLPHVSAIGVEGSKKMGYKAGYLPQERLGLHCWARAESMDSGASDLAFSMS